MSLRQNNNMMINNHNKKVNNHHDPASGDDNDDGFTTVSNTRQSKTFPSQQHQQQNHQYHSPQRKGIAPPRSKSFNAISPARSKSKDNFLQHQQQQQHNQQNSSYPRRNSNASTTSIGSTNTNTNSNGNTHKSPPQRSSSGRGFGGRNGGGRNSNGRGAPDRSKSSSAALMGSNNNSSNHNNNSKSRNNNNNYHRDVAMYNSTGIGDTSDEQQVIRWSAEALLLKRMLFLDPLPSSILSTESPENRDDSISSSSATTATTADNEGIYITTVCTPHDRCAWTASNRIEIIEAEMTRLFDYKPLQVNDETRWKPKVISTQQLQQLSDMQQQQQDELLKQSILAILNKLSWTNLDKLTVQFLKALGGVSPSNNTSTAETDPASAGSTTTNETAITSPHAITMVMKLVVEKAMYEPHFAELYARLTAKLASVHKTFKKSVLLICQEQFDETERNESSSTTSTTSVPNDETGSATTTTAITTNNQRSKMASIGLMKFIGELYIMSLIKGTIMVSCLHRLFVPNDEEKLECFAKLMTTIGERLHREMHKYQNEIEQQLWLPVYTMAGKQQQSSSSQTSPENKEVIDALVAPSVRIKFLLQDLIELKENDWVQVRHQFEKAKTIEQIHKEVAAEEEEKAQQHQRSLSLTPSRPNRSFSNNNMNKKKLRRSMSSDGGMMSSSASASASASFGTPRTPTPMFSQSTVSSSSDEDGYVKPKRSGIRRAKSDSVPTAVKRSISGDGLQDMISVPITSPVKGSRTNNTATSHSDGERNINPRNNGGRGGVRRNNSSHVQNRDNNNSNNNNNNRGPPNTPTRGNSTNNNNNNRSRSTGSRSPPLPPKRQVSSDNLDLAFEVLSVQPNGNNHSRNDIRQTPPSPPPLPRTVQKYSSPVECGNKAKTVFKEYFVSDDIKETIFSIQQLVGEAGSDNNTERCSKVVEAGVLLVMEMKESEVQKLLSVVSACVTLKLISPEALVCGLKDPLEFLRDIEIDAPMAAILLSKVISYWIYHPGFIQPTNSLQFLITDSPEYFRTDGKAAEFAIQILCDVYKLRHPPQHESNENVTNCIVSDKSKQVIERLLTESEMSAHGTLDNFIATMISQYLKNT